MDAISLTIEQLNFPIVTSAAAALDSDVLMIAITMLLVILSERRKEKLAKIAFAVLLAVILSMALKEMIKTDRPCMVLPSKIACPTSYSFPSGHTLVAFTVMLAFLNKRPFPLYFIYAIFIAFTRIYLGVHSFEDIAGSIGLAPLAYYTADILWNISLANIKGRKYAFRDKSG